jgi:hypothetical protein
MFLNLPMPIPELDGAPRSCCPTRISPSGCAPFSSRTAVCLAPAASQIPGTVLCGRGAQGKGAQRSGVITRCPDTPKSGPKGVPGHN